MASQRPYRAILSAKGGCNPNQQIRPKTMSSFILLNSYTIANIAKGIARWIDRLTGGGGTTYTPGPK